MTGRTIVITGASDGVGAAAARSLAASGERVVVVGRGPAKTERLAGEIGAEFHVADFADLGQVRALAEALRDRHARIDALVNNAGAIMPAYVRTADGHESTFQVNHLAGFLLTTLLLDELTAGDATVVTTSSDSASFGHLDSDLGNLDVDAARFDSKKVYGDTKLENILFTRELHRRHGLRAAAFHPGLVASNFASDTTTNWRWVYKTPLRHLVLASPERSIRTLIWLLSTTDWQPGGFYVKQRPTVPNPQVEDAALAERLWDRSADLAARV